MKKLLSILSAVSLTALASTTVVACGQQTEAKNPETLNGKTFAVNLDSLTVKTDGTEQEQWGSGTIGFLYSTLWSINQKNAEYPIQNQDVSTYLTKGESLVRGNDDGTNITINGKPVSEVVKYNTIDWHTHSLAEKDVIIFKVNILSYKGAKVIKTTPVSITINIK